MKPGTRVAPLPNESDRRCSRCGGVAQPFGRLRQWFCINEDVLLCTPCAREVIPDQVAIAEGFELYNDSSGGKTTES